MTDPAQAVSCARRADPGKQSAVIVF